MNAQEENRKQRTEREKEAIWAKFPEVPKFNNKNIKKKFAQVRVSIEFLGKKSPTDSVGLFIYGGPGGN